MIRKIARCPYCKAVVAIDDNTRDIVYNPDTARQQPCPHMAFLLAMFEVQYDSDEPYDACEDESLNWLWEHGRGLYRADGEDLPLSGYLLDRAYGILARDQRITGVPHRVRGGDADERERRRPGSGVFIISSTRRGLLTIALHAWSVYSPRPATLAAGVRRLIRM